MKLKSCLFLAGVLAATVSLSAESQIKLTFTGLALSPEAGYAGGSPVTFEFLLSNAATGLHDEGELAWEDDGAPANRVIDSFTGTGITGTWQSPVDAVDGEVNSALVVSTSGSRIDIYVTSFEAGDTGLFVNGFAFQGLELSFESTGFGFDSAVDGQMTFGFLGGYVGGPYSANEFAGELYIYSDDGGDGSVGFFLEELTISVVGAAVPEPSASAAIFGALVLTGAVVRRRRRA
ncbi:MAG: PEP-CTERM sorting domain-containing protein [Verrucomicrobiota bacterium]